MIRLRNRTRRCTAVRIGMDYATDTDTYGVMIPCPRHVGWWASWWTDRCPEHCTGTTLWLAWILASPSLTWHAASYWIRPYDMNADARRWRWQPPGCWRATRRGRNAIARLTEALNRRDTPPQ